MGKLIMPKHTGERVYFQAPLKVYYDANDWVSMKDFANQLYDELVAIGKEHSRNADNTHYTKCAQLPRYFGLVKRQTNANDADAKITPRGIKLYEALVADDMTSVHSVLVEAMETMTFGRDNEGCGSDSDVEPLGVFFRCVYTLNGLTGKEFGYILGELHEHGKSLVDVQGEISSFRNKGVPPPVAGQSLASNLADCKTLKLLKELGFIVEDVSGRMVVDSAVDAIYHERLSQLRITNMPPLKPLFKKWLSDNGYGVSVDSYPRSIEAISMPLSNPMSKTTGSWEGVYEYVIGEKPAKKAFEVSGLIDYLRSFSPLNVLLTKGVVPPVSTVDPSKHQELIDYTMLAGKSMDKGRLYCSNEAYKNFLRWFSDNKAKLGFSYTEEEKMYNKYLAAIRTKPFVLLAGISGTGKSRLVRQLARGCCPSGHELGKDAQGTPDAAKKPGNFEMIPVRPNWHDSTELMGYVTRITGTGKPKYVLTPFVKFLVKAWLHKDVPFFLCLDEMNLAPVEQYFAEYLSAVETRKKDGADIVSDVLVNFDQQEIDVAETVQELMADWIDVAADGTVSEKTGFAGAKAVYDAILSDRGVRIPKNFVVMGTVNMDETTCTFSRKVLDRAMSFELNVDESMYDPAKLAQEGDLAYGAITCDLGKDVILDGNKAYAALGQTDGDKVLAFIKSINTAMEGTQFRIAYRSRNEILTYCHERTKSGAISLRMALDEATSMKILSRIEGDEQKFQKFKLKDFLETVILELLKIDNPQAGQADVATFLANPQEVKDSPSATKLRRMADELAAGAGFVSYWEC